MYPDAPTFAEQGFPKLTTSTWVGISGPKGMSPDIVARLYDELQKAYKRRRWWSASRKWCCCPATSR